ncbi:sentrin-specific protease 6-like [Copidosoma floridanum]|uniref:sentrin-specific protease 6-like n=1 Tax=Copidosoma floridanum TaxID=29053 RepID=UPI000C6F4941|nr:sentrin-specific protease 6-like [Copidosoma floridanum]
MSSDILLMYPLPPKKSNISIRRTHLNCLSENLYMNDIIINFYLLYLYNDIISEKQRMQSIIYDSFFYTWLKSQQSKKIETSRKMTQQKMSIFKKDFLLLYRKETGHNYSIFNKESMKTYNVEVPQQPNTTDCGMYLLNCAEYFYKDSRDRIKDVEAHELWLQTLGLPQDGHRTVKVHFLPQSRALGTTVLRSNTRDM